MFLSRYYEKYFRAMMLRRSLLLFVTLGSLPRLESKGEKKQISTARKIPVMYSMGMARPQSQFPHSCVCEGIDRPIVEINKSLTDI
jgi:hypothetical protein